MESAIFYVDPENKEFLELLKMCGDVKTVETDHFDHVGQLLTLIVPATTLLASIVREYVREKIRANRDLAIAEMKYKPDVKVTIGRNTISILRADEKSLEDFFSLIEKKSR